MISPKDTLLPKAYRCSACDHRLKDPRSLSCEHKYCNGCLDLMLNSEGLNTIKCLICKRVTNAPTGTIICLPVDQKFKADLDKLGRPHDSCDCCDQRDYAVIYCRDCKLSMCKTCEHKHIEWPPHISHQVVTIADIRSGKAVLEGEVRCMNHTAEEGKHICTDVCDDCKTSICHDCATGVHRGHRVKSFQRYKKERDAVAKSMSHQTSGKLEDVKRSISAAESAQRRVTDHSNKVKAEIKEATEARIRPIKEREALLLRQCTEHTDIASAGIQEIISEGRRKVNQIQAVCGLIDKTKNVAPRDSTLLIITTLSEKLAKLLATQDPNIEHNQRLADIKTQAQTLEFCRENNGDSRLINLGEVRFVQRESCTNPPGLLGRRDIDHHRDPVVGIRAPHTEEPVGTPTTINTRLPTAKEQHPIRPPLRRKCTMTSPRPDPPKHEKAWHSVRRMKMETMKPVREIALEVRDRGSMNSFAISPDQKIVVGCHRGGNLKVFSRTGEYETTLTSPDVLDLVFTFEGNCVIRDTRNHISLHAPKWDLLGTEFETMSYDKGGDGDIAVDDRGNIYVSYRKARKIQMFSRHGGKATKEIQCKGYEPAQILVLNGGKALLIKDFKNSVRVINAAGNLKHEVTYDEEVSVFPAVRRDGSILLACVNHTRLSLEHYSRELKLQSVPLREFPIQGPERDWCVLREVVQGEFAFCTPDSLYLFKSSG